MEFPRLVYRKDEYKRVLDADQHANALGDGWFNSVPEALAGKADEPAIDEVSPPSRDELEAKAKELKIKFGKVTADEELMALIQERLES
jgi:hypothetical protein